MNKKLFFDAVINLLVLICLFALMNTIKKPIYGIPLTIIIITFVGYKIRGYFKWKDDE